MLLIIIYVSFISLGLPDSLLGSAWPSMYEFLSAPMHYAGYASMIIAGGTVISSVFSEKVIRRLGTGRVTFISVFMTAIALIGFSFSRNFIFLCFCAIPLGCGAGSVDAALNNYVALHYKAKHMSFLHCFWGIGASCGPLIMAFFLGKTGSWQWGYRTIALIQMGLVAVLFFAIPLWRKGTTEIVHKKSPSFSILFKIPGLKPALFTFFCYCTIETITGLWGSSYLVTVRNIAPEHAARWIALYYIGITGGRFISGFLTVRLNGRRMVRIGQLFIAIGVVLLCSPLYVPGFFIIGLGCAPIFPSLLHETPRNFGEEYSQSIMGLQMASAYIGTALMPPLFGKLASFTGFSILPFVLGIVLIIKIIMVEILNRRVGNRNS
ncbi:MFS transporter [Spirochaetia bacterium]|nr:MFS transporter [Spirochaetia bacterium]